MPDERTDGEWVVVFESGTDYAAELVRERLLDADIPAVVMAHRDHAFHLTVGSMASVAVRVPVSREAEARSLLSSPAIGEQELTRIALASAPVPDPKRSGRPESDGAEPGPESR